MPRLLLLLPAAGYANQDFIAAAARLNIEIVACADYCHRLAPGWGLPPLMSVPFDQPGLALPQVLAALSQPVDAVLAADDHGQALAAQLREALGLSGNPSEAVATLTDKLRFRHLQQAIGLPHPDFAEIKDGDINAAAALDFPLVVKARRLNASRGVIRANDVDQLARALKQVQRIQARAQRDAADLLVERFIPGVEVALDGVLSGGALRVLAVFDKPDPLDGPYFEETLFITPSRLPNQTQRELADAVERACVAAGVTEGVVHAEARINEAGVWLLEIAPRGIGGLCGRVFAATLGMDSAEIVLRHAVGLPLPLPAPANDSAAGVMMIPIPASGIFRGVDGLDAARAVPHITGIEITAPPGHLVAPPPEGAGYLGFLFSRAATPQQAEAALRAAHAALVVRIQSRVEP
ncbi:MAG TPA: ATP-grasp domain-containing protein [Thiobacillus sp.]|nr:ATP-grasp domain-containing protein [Thiobacillus sp.]